MDLTRLARAQQGVVSREQALTSGMTPAQIKWRLARGDWKAIHRGVYLTNSGKVEWKARARAALLRCGSGSALALESAAHLWGLERAAPRTITVAVPRQRHRSPVDGVEIVRRIRVDPVNAGGLPATGLAVTVIDLADRRSCSVDSAVALAARACQTHFVDGHALLQELESRARHRLRRQLRLALWEVAGGAESLPETWFDRRVRARHGMPVFERQVQQPDRTRTDLTNADYRVNVEIDGRLWHAGDRFHLDRKRDRRAAGRGEITLRVTPLELDQTPCEVAGELALVLRQRGWTGQAVRCSAACPVHAAS